MSTEGRPGQGGYPRVTNGFYATTTDEERMGKAPDTLCFDCCSKGPEEFVLRRPQLRRH